MTMPPEIIRPFFRGNGTVSELTAGDYATRGKVSRIDAIKALSILLRDKAASLHRSSDVTTYRLTEKGQEAREWPGIAAARAEPKAAPPDAPSLRQTMIARSAARLFDENEAPKDDILPDVINLMIHSAKVTAKRMKMLEKRIA